MPVGEVYFLTANCALRRPVFADTQCAEAVKEALVDYASRYGYDILLYCVMPTHVHVVVSARTGSSSLSEFVSRWKTWCVRQLRRLGVTGAVWQKEFLDHRVRSKASLGQKCEYVVHNPVRAGLVEQPEEWPHTGGAWWDEYLARRADQ